MSEENKNFMEELRNKLISDKFKEWMDDTNIKATLYKLVDEKDKLQQENQQLKSVLDEIREYIEENKENHNMFPDEAYELLQILDR